MSHDSVCQYRYCKCTNTLKRICKNSFFNKFECSDSVCAWLHGSATLFARSQPKRRLQQQRHQNILADGCRACTSPTAHVFSRGLWLVNNPCHMCCWTFECRLLLSHTSCHIMTFGKSNFPTTLWFDYNTSLTRVAIVCYRLVNSIWFSYF